jgi:hypothetical protein
MTIINSNEVTVDTVATAAKLGEIIVSADKRSTSENPLSDAQRIRRVVLPAGHWGNLTAGTIGLDTSFKPIQSLTDILTSGLRSIANAYLKETLAENEGALTVALADFSVSNLLAWSSETAASRGALTVTKEEIERWFPTSKLFAAMAARGTAEGKGTAYTDFMGKRLSALAAKNHGIKDEAGATKLIVLLADDTATAGDSIATEMVGRLAHIGKSFAAKTKESSSSITMDNL